VPGQGPSRSGFPRSHFYRTTHTPYGSAVGHGGITPGYDTGSPQQSPGVGQSPDSEYGYPSPVQSANWNSPQWHPPGLVAEQRPRLRLTTPPWSPSQDSAGGWDLLGGSSSRYSPPSANTPMANPPSFRGPGGFICELQSVQYTAAASQHPARVQSAAVGRYSTTGSRKALAIGINYYHTNSQLRHCIADARHMANFLNRTVLTLKLAFSDRPPRKTRL